MKYFFIIQQICIMKTITHTTYVIKIGNSSRENWNLLEKSSRDDIFFHLSKFPSPYVILTLHDCVLTDEILRECGTYCVNFSKFKNQKHLKVDYTSCSNVRKGEVLGECVYVQRKKVNIFSPLL